VEKGVEIERRIIKAIWGYDGCLEPLYEVEDKEDEISVTFDFDLPRVKKENVEINTTENNKVARTHRSRKSICFI